MNEEEKIVSPSRLGKEAKIGVTVILVLLLIFVGVVVLRLSGSGSSDGEAIAADNPSADSQSSEGDKGKLPLPPTESDGNTPTVLLANADSDRAPLPIDQGLNNWKQVPLDNGYNPKPYSPPPLPPEPSPSAGPGAMSSDPMAGMALASPPAGNELADAGQTTPGEVIERPSYNNPMRQEQTESNGHGSLGAPPLPPYREPNNPGDSGLPPSSAPSHPDRSYADIPAQSTQAAPISQYGTPDSGYRPPVSQYDEPDYRRQSPPPSRYDDAPRRRHGRTRSSDGPPPLDKDGKYEIQPLDSFWTISEKFFGTGAYFKALEEHNRDKIDDEGRLTPGDLVVVPTVEQLEKSYPDLCPKPERRETLRRRASNVGTNRNLHRGRTYKVNEGDTLFDIARYELGKAARWVEIYELNRDVLGKDFNYLTPGTVLAMPDDGRPDVLAEPPNTGYRR